MPEYEALDTSAGPQTTAAETRSERKRNKVRSAWISFVGRILAQLIGAAATIVLGLIVVDRYKSYDQKAHHDEAPAVVASAPVRQSSGLPAMAVLPVVDYSGGPSLTHFADGLTEALVAHLAQTPSVRVLSRTSSMAQKNKEGRLPALARELGADWIVESSIVRAGTRTRLTVQLIDAKSDEHVFARIYDATTRDLLALQTELARNAARDISDVLGKTRVQLAAATPEGRD